MMKPFGLNDSTSLLCLVAQNCLGRFGFNVRRKVESQKSDLSGEVVAALKMVNMVKRMVNCG